MTYLREIMAIARKENQMDSRFLFQFLFNSIISPVGRLIPLLIVYAALIQGKSESPIPGVTSDTYIPFLAIGIIFNTVWKCSEQAFKERFLREKFMQTIDLLFIAPVRTLSIIGGVGFADIIQNIPTFIFFLIVALIIHPTNLVGLGLAFVAFCLVVIFGLSLGLIGGGLSLATENGLPIWAYFVSGLTFLTPFFYPIQVVSMLPKFLADIIIPIIRLNPLNAGVTFARAAWLQDPLPWIDFLYLGLVSITMLFLSTHIFRFIWRKYGVQG